MKHDLCYWANWTAPLKKALPPIDTFSCQIGTGCMQLLRPSPGGKAPYGLSAIAVRKVQLWVILFGWAFALGYFAGTYSSHKEELNLRSAVTRAAPFLAPDGEVIVLRENLQNLTRIIEDLKTENERYGRDLASCLEKGPSDAASVREEPVCSRPKAAQKIPSTVAQATTDFYLRRIWGPPEKDLAPEPPQNLLAMSVGISNKVHVDYMIQKFPERNFSLVLFHYDDSSLSEWEEYSWSKRAVHIQAHGQGKWWFAKRFLHPDITGAYEHVFLWDEDLGLDNFNVLRFLDVMGRHSLEIAQPALFPYTQVHHNITKLVNGTEVHKMDPSHPLVLEGHESECVAQRWPPCAGFVEVMAPVFTRKAWACVWHLIQNDLVNGWGIDQYFHACAGGPAHQNMGIIDTDYIEHQAEYAPDSNQVFRDTGKTFKTLVEERSAAEDSLLRKRWHAGLAFDWDGPCTSRYDS